MAEVEILHRVYTNAAEDDATEPARARFMKIEDRDASSFVMPEVLAALDDLLCKTEPTSAQIGWVVRRFAADGGQTYACVIASHPNLVDAADRRKGVLNHARLVRVDAPSFDAAALIEAANDFPIDEIRGVPSGRRLRSYLDSISSEAAVLVLPVAVSELQSLPSARVIDVLIGCLSTLGRHEHVAMMVADANAGNLARMWAALPFASQRTSAWAVGVEQSCPVDVIFSTTRGRVPANVGSGPLVGYVEQYVRLLHEAPQAFNSMLVNPALTDANAFALAVQRFAIAPELSEMSKKDKGTKPETRRDRAEWQPLDPEVRSEMKRQFDAMEKTLQREMDERLKAFEERQRAQASQRGNASSSSPRWLVPLFGTLAALLFAATVLIVYGMRERSSPSSDSRRQAERVDDDEPVPAMAETAPSASYPAQQAVVRADTSEAWAEELKTLLQTDASFVSVAISDFANRPSITGAAQDELLAFATRVSRKEDLGSGGREQLRALLVECLAAGLPGSPVTIDGRLADVTPVLDTLRNRYRVRNTSSDPAQMSLQSEIILRWLAEREQ